MLNKQYANSLNTFAYGEETTNIINQIRIINNQNTTTPQIENNRLDEADLQHEELWIVRDDKANNRWVFTCRTLYEIKISKKNSREIERTYNVPYDSLWKYFGVDVELCDGTDIKMFMSMLLDGMVLEMPTINIGRHKNEDSDIEEEVHIKLKPIETIGHERHIVDIKGTKLPITMSLIGCGDKYFGIKAALYNRENLKEEGIFLRVETKEWLHDKAKINSLPNTGSRDKLKYFYSLPKFLVEKGFGIIFQKLGFSQYKVPHIETLLTELGNTDAFGKRFYNSHNNFIATDLMDNLKDSVYK